MLKGPFIRRANTLLLNTEIKQQLELVEVYYKMLYPHASVLLDHFVAIGSGLSSNKQANNNTLKFLVATGSAGPVR